MDETQRQQLQAVIAQAFKIIAGAAVRVGGMLDTGSYGTAVSTLEAVELIEGQLEVIRQLDGTLAAAEKG
jgi:hypothetical protein